MGTCKDQNAPAGAEDQPGDGGPGEAARLVSETVHELAQLSRRHGLETLGYLLEMAQLEADEIVRQNLKPPP